MSIMSIPDKGIGAQRENDNQKDHVCLSKMQVAEEIKETKERNRRKSIAVMFKQIPLLHGLQY